MAVLALHSVARATGGTVVSGDPDMEVSAYAIDSRQVDGGELFFALVGENNNAHRFLDDAFARGAQAAVVSEAVRPDFPAVRVENTTHALRDLARQVRVDWGGTVIGITGSCGKTTTKEMLALAVSGSRSTLATRGNLNNLFGLPLTLLGVLPGQQVAVLEMGISTPGEMTELAGIALPDVLVYLNVAAVHLMNFATVDDIAAAKGEALKVMGERGCLVYNHDDTRVRRLASTYSGRTYSFGLDAGADLYAERIDDSDPERITATLVAADRRVELELPVGGLHNLLNAVAAVAGAHVIGIGLDEAVSRLAAFHPPRQRGEHLQLAGGVTVWDESYNSNPVAMRAVLDTVRRGGDRRRVLVSGDMKELGPDEVRAHRELATAVAAAGVTLFVGVGPLSSHTVEALASEPAVEAIACDDAEAAARLLIERVVDGDLIVVKGSRSVGVDRVVEALHDARGGAV